MKRSRIFIAAAIASIGFTAPALADFVKLGSVDVGYRMDRDSKWTRFGGPMEGLRLEADRSNVKCRSIVAHFADGSQQNVFSGVLQDNRPVIVDVRGGARRVSDVSFTCRSDEFSGGKIYIEADVGRYQAEWRRSPDWALLWSRLFNWGNAQSGYDANYWVTLGQTRFEGRNDREAHFSAWAGNSVERIGLKAVNDDARCSRVRVTFASGMSTMLDVGRLDQGRMKSIDLPGGNRAVRDLNMVCRPMNKNGVTVEIS